MLIINDNKFKLELSNKRIKNSNADKQIKDTKF